MDLLESYKKHFMRNGKTYFFDMEMIGRIFYNNDAARLKYIDVDSDKIEYDQLDDDERRRIIRLAMRYIIDCEDEYETSQQRKKKYYFFGFGCLAFFSFVYVCTQYIL
jgi:hypothetical protein